MSSTNPVFRYNPITGQLDLSDDHGSGPGGSVTFNADNGTPETTNDIDILGISSQSAKVMETSIVAGQLMIANNSWDTAYVVDPSTTFGEKGTFQTVQDAIDAAVADGVATSNNYGVIDIRMKPFNTYVEDLNIPSNVRICLRGPVEAMLVGPQPVYIQGLFTVASGASLLLQNVGVVNGGSDCFSNNGNIYLNNTWCQGASGTGRIFAQNTNLQNINTTGGSVTAYSCNLSTSGDHVLEDTAFCFVDCIGTNSASQLQLNGTSEGIISKCTGMMIAGDTNGNITIENTTIFSSVDLQNAIVTYNNVSLTQNSTSNQLFTTAFNQLIPNGASTGNIFKRRPSNIAVDTVGYADQYVSMFYNGSCTITFDSTLVKTDQVFYFMDESGSASTNPRTIVAGSGKTINGQANLVIDWDYGWAIVTYDGTNYFAMTDRSKFSEPIGQLSYFSNKNGDSYLGGLWLKCDGSILSQATYPVLYSRMGLINEGGINWTAITSGTTNTMRAATFGSSKHLIAGENGILRSSTDGITWTIRNSGFSSTIRSLTFGGGNFIYGGEQGALATSTDGITWQTKNPSLGRRSNPNQGTFGPFMTYNAGTFVGMCPDNGNLLTSTDGITWTTRDNNLNATPSNGGSVAYGAGIFCAVFGSGLISTSTDGINWTARTSGTTTSLTSLQYVNSLFCAGAGQFFFTSTDGITWANVNTGISTGNAANCTVYAFGAYYYWTGIGAKTSTDLVNWTNILGSPGTANVAVFNGTLIVIGLNSGIIRTSTNGSTWNAQTSQTTSTITALIYNGSNLHVYGTANGGIGTSTDGITWVARTSGTTSTIQSLLYDGSLYHASVLHATLTSTDAITWTTNTGYSGTTSTILSTAYGNSTYVYGTSGGRIATSLDTLVWTAQTSGTTSNINALAYGLNFVYGTAGGGLSTSTDGITWTAQTSGTTSDINALRYGSLYVYGGNGGVLASSTDAVTWTTRTSNTTSSIFAIRYANDFYIAAGQAGMTIQSNGGTVWYSRVSATTSTIFAASTGAGVFVETGQAGALQTALNDYPYNRSTQFQLPTDNALLITTEAETNFFRSLYIKALN